MADLADRRGNVLLMALLMAGVGLAGEPQAPADLTEANLETLMNMEVSSPARRDQKLSQTAAAVYVITQEDIRRSGMSSIPELLRMVPGLQVAQIDASSWSVTARGFPGQFADKMLVLIDGRTIYNHLFAGVYWELNRVPLDDIERIEVIRGPGAAAWGANAMNGVINIITKNARETQGLTVTAAAGNEELGAGTLRYGGMAGEHIAYRLYADSLQDGSLATAGGGAAHDRWDSAQGGGRLDWQLSDRDDLSFEGDYYRGSAEQSIYPDYLVKSLGQPYPDTAAFSGGSISGAWKHRFSDRSDLALRLSENEEDRSEGFGQLLTGTSDLDFQHHLALSSRQDLTWGLGVQVYQDQMSSRQIFPEPAALIQMVPAQKTESLASFFAQDQIALVPGRLTLTLGTKVERTSYSGFDNQPTARLLWNATARQGAWASVSRAVHQGGLIERDAFVEYQPTSNPSVIGLLIGNPNFQPETVLAYEAGYRNQPARWLTVDLASFFSIYHELNTFDIGNAYLQTGADTVLVVPTEIGNGAAGHTYGVEISTNWILSPKWRVNANYSWFRYGLDSSQIAPRSLPVDTEGSSPDHQFQLRSEWDLGRRFTCDVALYYVSALLGLDIPAYARTDARLGWRVSQNAEISLAGQNLLDGRHAEFDPALYTQASQIGRTVQLKVTWAF